MVNFLATSTLMVRRARIAHHSAADIPTECSLGASNTPSGEVDISDAFLRRSIQHALPEEAFQPSPARCLIGTALVLAIVGTSAALTRTDLPFALSLPISLLLGNFYVCLMFFGHEVGHGALTRSRALQEVFLWCSLIIYIVPPHLWRTWHNLAHHGRTNTFPDDPDCPKPAEWDSRKRSCDAWVAARIQPGSGHWLSSLYLFVAFTIQGQLVLWRESRTWTFRGFSRWRAIFELVIMATLWAVITASLGRSAVFVVLLPMLAANAIIMSYVSTNHMLRQVGDSPSILQSTMSVRTLGVLDWMHFRFSHHTEHHLFPGVSHRFYPLVRSELQRLAGHEYLNPTHWKALCVLYSTPPRRDVDRSCFNPLDGTRVSLEEVKARLL